MKIVLDTNVIVSGLLSANGNSAKILNLVLNSKCSLLYDNRILEEYSEVLARKKFEFPKEWTGPLLDFIKYEGEFVSADPLQIKFSDEDDKKFFEVAATGKAKYLITGNKKHFPRVASVKSPSEFIELL